MKELDMTAFTRLTLTTATLFATALIAGCGGDDKAESTSTTPAPPASPEATATPTAAEKKKDGKGKKGKPAATATAEPTAEQTPAGAPDAEGRLPLRMTISSDGIKLSATALPASKPLKLRIFAKGGKKQYEVSAETKGELIGTALVKGKAPVLLVLRPLEPGRLKLTAGKLEATVPIR